MAGGGIEGERPHGERTPQQSKPTEQHKPHHEEGVMAPLGFLPLYTRGPNPRQSPAYEGREGTGEQVP